MEVCLWCVRNRNDFATSLHVTLVLEYRKGKEEFSDYLGVVCVMKMVNIGSRAEVEPGIRGQWATISPCRLPDVTTIPHAYVSMQVFAS